MLTKGMRTRQHLPIHYTIAYLKSRGSKKLPIGGHQAPVRDLGRQNPIAAFLPRLTPV